jgi:hypothetical protein
MKLRLIALLLTLAVYSWAQNPAPADKAQPEKNATTAPASGHDCACCGHHAGADAGTEAKSAHACCAGHEAKADSGQASCCSAKGEQACMKGDKDRACSQAGADGKDCCSGHAMSCKPGEKNDPQAKGCCGKSCSHTSDAPGV